MNTDSSRGRTVHEVSFDQTTRIGQYPSFDLFGDGSFYILDVPGHAVGHIAGLARTTCDTFVFMGGDVCHFGGSFRPTPYKPMPSTIPESVPLDKNRFRVPCPCSIFTTSHRDPPNARTSTFYKVTQDPGGCELSFPSTYIPVGRTSRGLRHVSAAATWTTYFALPSFYP